MAGSKDWAAYLAAIEAEGISTQSYALRARVIALDCHGV